MPQGVIAEGFNRFFTLIVKAIGENLFQRSDPSCQRQWSPSQNAEAVLTNVTFELSPPRSGLVHMLLRKLKTNKATSLEYNPARLLLRWSPGYFGVLDQHN